MCPNDHRPPFGYRKLLYSFVGETDREEKNGKSTPGGKTKKKEKDKISRYGSFYLRLGAIGKVTS